MSIRKWKGNSYPVHEGLTSFKFPPLKQSAFCHEAPAVWNSLCRPTLRTPLFRTLQWSQGLSVIYIINFSATDGLTDPHLYYNNLLYDVETGYSGWMTYHQSRFTLIQVFVHSKSCFVWTLTKLGFRPSILYIYSIIGLCLALYVAIVGIIVIWCIFTIIPPSQSRTGSLLTFRPASSSSPTRPRL